MDTTNYMLDAVTGEWEPDPVPADGLGSPTSTPGGSEVLVDHWEIRGSS